jgi:hypothetical protein
MTFLDRKHDPYWDIPLNESLLKPVIELPVSVENPQFFGGEQIKKKGRKRKREE